MLFAQLDFGGGALLLMLLLAITTSKVVNLLKTNKNVSDAAQKGVFNILTRLMK